MNQNYYKNINPLARILTAKTKHQAAARMVATAISQTVGEPLPLPDGWSKNYSDNILPPEAVADNRHGISQDGWLRTDKTQGSVDRDFMLLEPEKILAITEAVEAAVNKIESTAKEYCQQCQRTSAERLIKNAAALAALAGPQDVAQMLINKANEISTAGKTLA